MQALVSIVVPCYKGERFLREAIESCLAQSYRNLEIIVVDDCSPDQCAAIAQRFADQDSRVKLLKNARNQGVSMAFNAGFAAARGKFFTRLAQDDLFQRDAIEVMVAYLESSPCVGLVYCDEQLMDENGALLQTFHTPEPEELLREGNKAGLCVMWRREVWEKLKGFNPEFDSAEDYDFWVRASRFYKFKKVEGPPKLLMRWHAQMGSVLFSGKQDILMAKIRLRHTKEPWFRRRLILKDAWYNSAYSHRQAGRHGTALAHGAMALLFWPFDCRLYKLILAIPVLFCGRIIWKPRNG